MARKLIDTVQQNYTITIYTGVTYSRIFQYMQSDGNPVNLTGKVIKMEFKDVFTSTMILLSSDVPTALGSKVEITDAVNGYFRVEITSEETATAVIGPGKWWIELIDGSDSDLLWLDCVNVVEV